MNIRDAIGQINFMGNRRKTMKDMRGLILGTTAAARRGDLAERLESMASLEDLADKTTAAWVEPDQIGLSSGDFDVCDLRVWVALAERAGVAHVPAIPILSVTEDELSGLLGTVEAPENLMSNMRKHVGRALSGMPRPEAHEPTGPSDARLAEVYEKMSSVMEDIPPSWMVRTHICGSSNLKALVGTGVMLKGDDVAQIAPGVSLGAGWVQVGNRREIDFRDSRFVSLGVAGHKPVTHYLARPWETPARFHDGEDLHRAGSSLAGPGKWPAEWRVFLRNGKVTGVANYYAWTGDGATPQNAWNALAAAADGQLIADTACALSLRGAFMDEVFVRMNTHPATAIALEAWDADGFHATIDFLETRSGMMMLEAGPAHMPGGGGHPCAFAGKGVRKEDPRRMVADCEGVAFRIMPHISLADPRTWVDGDHEGAFASFEEAADLASAYAPLTERQVRFLAEIGVVSGPQNEGPEI